MDEYNSPRTLLAAPGASRAWLEQFEPVDRNPIAQFFNRLARESACSPEGLAVQVAAHMGGRLASAWGDASEQRRMQTYLDALAADFASACSYAASVIAWVNLPEHERQRLKEELGRPYQQQVMATQPPTEKQLAYLRRLGFRGPAPASKAEASGVIDELLAEARS